MSDAEEIDAERLTAALHERGVRFVGPTPARADPPSLTDADLLRGLALSPQPLHREALIALLLRRPGLAQSVGPALAALPETAAAQLKLYYSAAMYLQHLWRTRLGLYLGPFEPLPDGHEDRHEHVGRYGSIDVYHFDLYSTALRPHSATPSGRGR